MATVWKKDFTGEVDSPAAARVFASSVFDKHLFNNGDVLLVVSELVTNAVRAGSKTVSLEISVSEAEVVVSVTDDAAGWPVSRTPTESEATGRGLPLIAAVSRDWGVEANNFGKTTWVRIAAHQVQHKG